jgi:hypothetical protein
MSAQTLRSYFESDIQQRLALDAVAREGWLDPGRNLDFYEETWRAFDPSSSADEAFQAFENIYGELKGPTWQVFRSRKKRSGLLECATGFRDNQPRVPGVFVAEHHQPAEPSTERSRTQPGSWANENARDQAKPVLSLDDGFKVPPLLQSRAVPDL